MTIKKIQLGGGSGSFSGTMDDIPNGSTYVKTENNLTDAEKTKLSNLSGTNSGDNAVNSLYSGLSASKQDTLVSGTNIKTINGTSLLGSGDLTISGGGSISYEESVLETDVVMSTSNLFYDIVSVSLSAGTWLLNAHLTQVRGATTAETIVARLTDKTTNYASQQMYHPSASGAGVALSMTKVLVLESATTIFLQCATNSGNANSRVEAATTINASGNNATILNAIKIA
jgi:hypothetical protein